MFHVYIYKVHIQNVHILYLYVHVQFVDSNSLYNQSVSQYFKLVAGWDSIYTTFCLITVDCGLIPCILVLGLWTGGVEGGGCRCDRRGKTNFQI